MMKPLSDPQTRNRACVLAASAPLKIPRVVKEGWGVIALAIIVGIIPSLFATAWLLSKSLPMLRKLIGLHVPVPMSAFFVLSLLIVAVPVGLYVYYQAGLYTCRLANYFVLQGKFDDAETVALGFQSTVWYLHLWQDRQFASFARAADLGSKSQRYAKYLARLK